MTAPFDETDRLPTVPLIARNDHGQPSIFLPEVMLREARKQKGLQNTPVPSVCILDPDGDMVIHVIKNCAAMKSHAWACFHTELWEWEEDGQVFGIIGRAVGASFAVLVAEQLAVSGCDLIISIASAGSIAPDLPEPCYVLIESALRDEGTSYHYLPPSTYVEADRDMINKALQASKTLDLSVIKGSSWTTDAPFRETAETISSRREQGLHIVEMEAAALLAFAQAKHKPLIAIAHITNCLGQTEGGFDKGIDFGAKTSLTLAKTIANALSAYTPRINTPKVKTI